MCAFVHSNNYKEISSLVSPTLLRLILAYTNYNRHSVGLLRSVYSFQTLSSKLVLCNAHLVTAKEHLLQLYVVCVYVHVDISICVSMSTCICDPQQCLPPVCRMAESLYCYRQWLAAHICVRVTSLTLKASSGRETEMEGEMERKRVKRGKKEVKKEETNKERKTKRNKQTKTLPLANA